MTRSTLQSMTQSDWGNRNLQPETLKGESGSLRTDTAKLESPLFILNAKLILLTIQQTSLTIFTAIRLFHSRPGRYSHAHCCLPKCKFVTKFSAECDVVWMSSSYNLGKNCYLLPMFHLHCQKTCTYRYVCLTLFMRILININVSPASYSWTCTKYIFDCFIIICFGFLW